MVRGLITLTLLAMLFTTGCGVVDFFTGDTPEHREKRAKAAETLDKATPWLPQPWKSIVEIGGLVLLGGGGETLRRKALASAPDKYFGKA